MNDTNNPSLHSDDADERAQAHENMYPNTPPPTDQKEQNMKTLKIKKIGDFKINS